MTIDPVKGEFTNRVFGSSCHRDPFVHSILDLEAASAAFALHHLGSSPSLKPAVARHKVKAAMDTQRESNGWQTFLEHWWLMPFAVVSFLSSQLLTFFMRLSGTRWIWCYAIGLGVAAVGALLIFYAKIPLYRRRRFSSFGCAALPEGKRSFYRWGYRCVILAVALFLCLFLSRL